MNVAPIPAIKFGLMLSCLGNNFDSCCPRMLKFRAILNLYEKAVAFGIALLRAVLEDVMDASITKNRWSLNVIVLILIVL